MRFDGLRDGSQPDDQKNLGRLSTGIISISEEVNTAFRTGPQRQMFVHPVDSIQTDNSPKLALNMIPESSSQNKKCTFCSKICDPVLMKPPLWGDFSQRRKLWKRPAVARGGEAIKNPFRSLFRKRNKPQETRSQNTKCTFFDIDRHTKSSGLRQELVDLSRREGGHTHFSIFLPPDSSCTKCLNVPLVL